MDRRTFLVTGGTASVGALTGCLGSAQSQPNDGAGTDAPESRRTIRVGQSGEATIEPNLAVLQVAVEANGDTARAVRNDLANRSGNLREALIEFGIEEDAITTARYDIAERRVEPVERPEPGTNDGEDREASQLTYEGIHAFSVEVSEVDAIGAVIDTAVDAGADSIGRVRFTVTDETRERLREAALRDAMGNARSEADVLADEAGGSVAGIREIRSSDSTFRPVTRDHVAVETADDGGGTELVSGDVTVTAHVEVTYDLA